MMTDHKKAEPHAQPRNSKKRGGRGKTRHSSQNTPKSPGNMTLNRNLKKAHEFLVNSYEILQWLGNVLNEEAIKIKKETELAETLKSGIVLGQLLNALVSRDIIKVHKNVEGKAFMQRENIEYFIDKSYEVYGFPRGVLFEVSDLFEEKNMLSVVNSLFNIEKESRKTFKGPYLQKFPEKCFDMAVAETFVEKVKKWEKNQKASREFAHTKPKQKPQKDQPDSMPVTTQILDVEEPTGYTPTPEECEGIPTGEELGIDLYVKGSDEKEGENSSDILEEEQKVKTLKEEEEQKMRELKEEEEKVIKLKQEEEEKALQLKAEEERLQKMKEQQRKQKEEEEKLRKQKEEENLRKQKEEEEKLRKQKEEEEKLRKQKEEDENLRKQKEEEEKLRKQKEEEEKLRKQKEEEEKLRKQKEEEEKLRKQEEEEEQLRKQKEEEENLRKQEEEEQLKKQEEEEQLKKQKEKESEDVSKSHKRHLEEPEGQTGVRESDNQTKKMKMDDRPFEPIPVESVGDKFARSGGESEGEGLEDSFKLPSAGAEGGEEGEEGEHEKQERMKRSLTPNVLDSHSIFRTETDERSVKVSFRIHYFTQPGQHVAVVGNVPALGMWEVSDAFVLTHEGEGWWAGSFATAINSIRTVSSTFFTSSSLVWQHQLEYKYIIMDDARTKVLRWEEGENRILRLQHDNHGPLALHDWWEARPDLPEPCAPEQPMQSPTSEEIRLVRFSINAYFLHPDEEVYLTGNLPQLGEWKTKQSIPLDQGHHPMWSVTLPISKSVEKFEYKFLIRTLRGHAHASGPMGHLLSIDLEEGVIWEMGQNRVCDLRSFGNCSQIILNEGVFWGAWIGHTEADLDLSAAALASPDSNPSVYY